VTRGRQILEDSVPLYPAYVHGVRVQALGALPKSNAFFAEAAQAARASYDGCGTDANAFDTLSFKYPTGPTQGTCWNAGIVLHVWEGIALIAGDVFVKSGDAAKGRGFYAKAKLSPTYDHWPFKQELEKRIADADAHAALYLDADEENDPPTWMDEGHLCVGCHADQN
jgi:hypothetical protein